MKSRIKKILVGIICLAGVSLCVYDTARASTE